MIDLRWAYIAAAGLDATDHHWPDDEDSLVLHKVTDLVRGAQGNP